jgi:serine/threonine protein kinase
MPELAMRHFEIQGLIGKGSYGTVYKAIHKEGLKTFVLKKIDLKAIKARVDPHKEV